MYQNNHLLSGFSTTRNNKLPGNQHAELPLPVNKNNVLAEKITYTVTDDQYDVLPNDQDDVLLNDQYDTLPDDQCDTLPDDQYDTLPDDQYDIIPDDHYDTLPENDANVQHNDNYDRSTLSNYNVISLTSEPKQVISKCENKDSVFYYQFSR